MKCRLGGDPHPWGQGVDDNQVDWRDNSEAERRLLVIDLPPPARELQ